MASGERRIIDQLPGYMEGLHLDSQIKPAVKDDEKVRGIVPHFWIADENGRQQSGLASDRLYYLVIDVPITDAFRQKVRKVRGEVGAVEPDLQIVLYNGSNDVEFGEVEFHPTQVEVHIAPHYRLVAPVKSFGYREGKIDCTFDLMLGVHDFAEGQFSILLI